MEYLEWEEMNTSRRPSLCRLRIHGGWLVQSELWLNTGAGIGLTFVPDPDHEWQLEGNTND